MAAHQTSISAHAPHSARHQSEMPEQTRHQDNCWPYTNRGGRGVSRMWVVDIYCRCSRQCGWWLGYKVGSVGCVIVGQVETSQLGRRGPIVHHSVHATRCARQTACSVQGTDGHARHEASCWLCTRKHTRAAPLWEHHCYCYCGSTSRKL